MNYNSPNMRNFVGVNNRTGRAPVNYIANEWSNSSNNSNPNNIKIVHTSELSRSKASNSKFIDVGDDVFYQPYPGASIRGIVVQKKNDKVAIRVKKNNTKRNHKSSNGGTRRRRSRQFKHIR